MSTPVLIGHIPRLSSAHGAPGAARVVGPPVWVQGYYHHPRCLAPDDAAGDDDDEDSQLLLASQRLSNADPVTCVRGVLDDGTGTLPLLTMTALVGGGLVPEDLFAAVDPADRAYEESPAAGIAHSGTYCMALGRAVAVPLASLQVKTEGRKAAVAAEQLCVFADQSILAPSRPPAKPGAGPQVKRERGGDDSDDDLLLASGRARRESPPDTVLVLAVQRLTAITATAAAEATWIARAITSARTIPS